MAPRVAIIANDRARADALARILASEHIDITVHVQSTALDISWDLDGDLALIDAGLGQHLEDEENLVDFIHSRWHMPVLMVVGDRNMDRGKLLEKADDFIVEPVRQGELAARINLLVRKSGGDMDDERLRFGDLSIDTAGCQVSLGRSPVSLTFKEYELLTFLAQNPGRVFQRETLLRQVWGYDYYGGERTVDVHIRRLRAKLEVAGRTFIETVRGAGYRFRADGRLERT